MITLCNPSSGVTEINLCNPSNGVTEINLCDPSNVVIQINLSDPFLGLQSLVSNTLDWCGVGVGQWSVPLKREEGEE